MRASNEASPPSVKYPLEVLEAMVAKSDARLAQLDSRRSRLLWRILDLQPALVVAIIALLLSV